MPMGPYNYIPQLFPWQQQYMGKLAANNPIGSLYQSGQGFNMQAFNDMLKGLFKHFAPDSGGRGFLQSAFHGMGGGQFGMNNMGGHAGLGNIDPGGSGPHPMPGQVGRSIGSIFSGSQFSNPYTGETFNLADPGSTLDSLNQYLMRNFGVNDVYEMFATNPKYWGQMAGEIQHPRFDPTTGALVGPGPANKNQAEKYQTISSSMASFLQEQQRQNAISEMQRTLGLSQGAFPGTDLGLQMGASQGLAGLYQGTQYQPGDYSYFLQKYLGQGGQGGQGGGFNWQQLLGLIGPLLGAVI